MELKSFLVCFIGHWIGCGGFIFGIPNIPSIQNLEKIKEDVRNQSVVANSIIQQMVYGAARNETYNRIADVVDRFGSRYTGTLNLEHAIDYILEKMKNESLDNVHGEPVQVPHWFRGEESATLLKPRIKDLPILGLGSSIGTPTGGIRAQAIVVRSWDDLEGRASEVRGKIVVFNYEWVNYGVSGRYRIFGAQRAAAVGAVATLIRSATPFSINSPHTGWQFYNDSIPKIPTACITVEDAELITRMAERGETVEIVLKMEAQTLPDTQSRNIISQITGSKYPEQVIVLAGHIDSWDVGQGAMDDAAGAILGWQALSMIRHLGLQPKRTIRSVLYTAEEEVYVGADAYYQMHKNDTSNYDFVMESDIGTFKPIGLSFGGSTESVEVMKEVMNLLKPINASNLRMLPNFNGGDNNNWVLQGVPGASLDTQNDKYFYFHHTEGDTMTVLDPHELDLCTALWTVVAYTLANIEDMLPRNI